jgi:hypothetical protein
MTPLPRSCPKTSSHYLDTKSDDFLKYFKKNAREDPLFVTCLRDEKLRIDAFKRKVRRVQKVSELHVWRIEVRVTYKLIKNYLCKFNILKNLDRNPRQ